MVRATLIILLSPLFSFGTNYYFSATGNDANNGLSQGFPKQTLAAARGLSLVAGDSVLFKRGDTFRGYYIASNSGSIGNPIIYGAYGAGAIPIISGAKNYSSAAQWQVYSGNIWKTVAPVGSVITSYVGHHDVANLIFNNDAFTGKKEILVSSCDVQGDWTILAGDTLYLFSLGNPGTFYTNIEVGGVYSENVFKISGKNYITVQNFDIRYSGNNEIFIETCTNIKVDSCKFQWTGGWWFDAAGKRMGNGVQMWQTNSDIEVSNNYIFQTYDAGISPQGNPVTYTQSNISMHHNIIEQAYYSYEVFLRSPNTFSNLTFEYNTCINAGYQWSQHQRPDSLDAEHIRQAVSTGTISGCTIRYNSFLGTYNRYAQMDVTSGMICNFNCFANIPIYGKFNGTTYTTLPQWRTGSNFDINSTLCAPVANAGADQAITLPTNSISILGSGTAATGNTITAYLWTKLASSPAGTYFITNTNPGLSLSNLIAGTYQFSLRVTDNAGSTNTDTMQLIVSANPNLPPVANAGIDQVITLPTSSVTLNGSGSTDPDGTITAYAWNYVSGPAGSTITTPAAVSTTVTGLVQGVYIFSLTVTDNNGGVNSDGVQITVNAAAIPPPSTGTIMLRGWKIIN
jgi:hypothetical protein